MGASKKFINALKDAKAVEVRTKWFNYSKGADFEVSFVDQEDLRAMMENTSDTAFKKGQESTEINEKRFRKVLLRKAVRGWNLTVTGLISLLLWDEDKLRVAVAEHTGTDPGTITGDTVIPYDPEVMELICESSTGFDGWLFKIATDPGYYSRQITQEEVKN